MQSDASSLPVTSIYLPAMQSMQSAVESVPYLPLRQGVQEEAPGACSVFVTDPAAQSAYEVGPDLSSLGDYKFNGGACLGPDGTIYGIHRFSHGKILCVEPSLEFRARQLHCRPIPLNEYVEVVLWLRLS